ncbi:MAG: transporter [Candidatus Omnitrophota bacterium]
MRSSFFRVARHTVFAACTILFLSVAIVTPCYSVNYLDGAHAPKGPYLLTYPYWYGAQKLAGAHGNTVTNDMGLNKYAVLLRPVYYGENYVVHTIIPVGGINAEHPNSSAGGLGDIILGAGYFLPVKSLDILPVLNVKFPSGYYSKHKSINFGDGQFDLRPELYFHKVIGKVSIDTAVKYWIRYKNSHISFTPGNEFYAEGVVVYELFKKFRVGPTVAFCYGANGTLDEKYYPDNAVTKLSIGGEMVFNFTQKAHFLLDVVPDVYAENSPKGLLVLGRFCYSF